MKTITVEVSDKLAKKFWNTKVVSSDVLYEELDNERWTSVHVWEKAEVVLDFLKGIK